MIHHSLSPGHISSWAQFKCALVRKSRLLLTFWWSSMIHSSEGLERMTSLTAAQAIPWHVSWCWAWLWRCIFLLPLYSSPGPTEFNNSGPELNSHLGHPHGARRQRWARQLFPIRLNVFTRECARVRTVARPDYLMMGGWHDDVVGMMMWLTQWLWDC